MPLSYVPLEVLSRPTIGQSGHTGGQGESQGLLGLLLLDHYQWQWELEEILISFQHLLDLFENTTEEVFNSIQELDAKYLTNIFCL